MTRRIANLRTTCQTQNESFIRVYRVCEKVAPECLE